MEKSTKIIISMMIIVLIIIITIIAILKINQSQIEKENDNPETIAFTDVEKLSNKNLFYQINYNINKYITYIKEQNTEAINAISPNKLELKKYSEANITFRSKEMYSLDKISDITVYLYGVSRQKNVEAEHYLIVNLDYTNNTFEILNSSKEEFDNAKNNIIDAKYKENIQIKPNNYNEIEDKKITDFEILQYHFEDYKYKVLYNINEAFNMLDEQYRQKKFNNDINNYKTYIQNNINRFQDANIVKHGIIKEGQKVEYIAIDNFNNYYKIIENGINNYTIILDNYTLETDEVLEKYNKLSDKEKVASNIDKVMQLINEKEYNELYKYLNEDFKNTYFKTQESFEKYLTTNFFENNIVGTFSIENEGNIYIVKVPYKESLSTAAQEAEKTFIVKLGEGTDFEISFNVD